MAEILDASLPSLAAALRARDVSAEELVEEAIWRHRAGERLHAYKHFDAAGARQGARAADELLDADPEPPAFCGLPVSVKDLYGVDGLPTFAGTARQLPEGWSRDSWLVHRLRAQGAVLMGKTHTVELAYGAVGINPHWGTPWNPWDAHVHRIPGGSSCGAGVSLWEGSAVLALGTDTGGSIRIPASMTGVVGHKITHDRWSTGGVVPLSTTLDSVGGLARTVEDSAFFFGAVDPAWGDPWAFLTELRERPDEGLRVGLPRCGVWEECQPDVADVLVKSVETLEHQGWHRREIEGGLLDEAGTLYMTGGIAGAECRAFLERDLPGWLEILDPTVGGRLAGAPALTSETYARSSSRRRELLAAAPELFDGVDVLALPAAMITPPPVSELADLERYLEVNAMALRPTCPVSMLGLCAVTLPVGLDAAGMPVGLQLVAPAGQDELALAAALRAEQLLDTPTLRL